VRNVTRNEIALLISLAAAAILLVLSGAALADSCAALADAPPEGTRITLAEAIADREDLPAFCRVTGEISPQLGFEMRLPLDNWNGRFLMSGCGAYCGKPLPERIGYSNSINYALRRGYAAVTTDAGHQAESSIVASWAYNNRPAEEMWAHRWVPLATAVGRALLRQFYGQEEKYAYFSGCSNGGRTAAMVAQRYPELYDGVASGAPALDVTYATALQGAWLDRTLLDEDGELILGPAKISLLRLAVLEQCDGRDGLVDGIVSDPMACEFDPASLQCGERIEGADCLTQVEVNELEQLYGGARDSQGRQVYPGLPYGSEQYWSRWLIGETDGQRHVSDMGSIFLRYVGFEVDPGPGYNSREFDFDTDIPKLAAMAKLLDATDPDLRGLQQAQGKLLMYHGLADALVLPQSATSYYESVVREFSGADDVNDFFRLFMVPGMDHCWAINGYAPDLFDPLEVLERWVELGEAPERIVARQHAETGEFEGRGPVIRTRPLCPYPQRAEYLGEGSPDLADSFRCVTADKGSH